MSVANPALESAVPPVPVWRVSVERYHEMIHTGALTASDRLELLDGWLVPKMTLNPPHRGVVFRVREALREALPKDWYVDAQVPITLATSEPEPDVVVVRGESDDYLDHHPGPAEVGLVVEVADSSLTQDRVLKRAIYAQAAISHYWIVNLVHRRLEVYSDPTNYLDHADYRQEEYLGLDQQVALILEAREICRIPVARFLPREAGREA